MSSSAATPAETKHRYWTLANAAVAYARSCVTTIGDDWGNNSLQATPVYAVYANLRVGMQRQFYGDGGDVRLIASQTKQTGRGNCGELAALAYLWLLDRGERPIAIAGWDNWARDSHTFVLLGFDRSRDVMEMAFHGETIWPQTLGENCVICDPWRDCALPASSYVTRGYKGINRISNSAR